MSRFWHQKFHEVTKEVTRMLDILDILIFRHDPVRIGKIFPGVFRRFHRDASNGEKLIYRDDGADFDCEVTKEVTRMVDIWIS